MTRPQPLVGYGYCPQCGDTYPPGIYYCDDCEEIRPDRPEGCDGDQYCRCNFCSEVVS